MSKPHPSDQPPEHSATAWSLVHLNLIIPPLLHFGFRSFIVPVLFSLSLSKGWPRLDTDNNAWDRG